eukprot:CAMPEP_0183827184 /NCGR_PEP_ID=MMETSP0807_2-20130328/2107_1 /TAXON_ID=88271 /ORGANISM="Picocystis salinarum, Strain CCMP1897" /LENGTH=225 /DNA_ID=CAMNT_0026072337 /DNA_START=9 /DNA_END=686 /DNA_ORIENTATION=-
MATARAFPLASASRGACSTRRKKEKLAKRCRSALEASKTAQGRAGKDQELERGTGRRDPSRREVQWAAATWLVGVLGAAQGAWGRPTPASANEGAGRVAQEPKEEVEGTTGESGPPLYDAKSVPTRSSIAWKAAGAVGAMLATTLLLEQRLPAIQRAKRISQKVESMPSEDEEAWEDAPTDVPSAETGDAISRGEEEQGIDEDETQSWQAVQEGLQEARNRSQKE